jgi:hypothetical protein
MVWIAMRLLGSDCTVQHIENQRFAEPMPQKLDLDGAKDLDTLLVTVKEAYKASVDRRGVLTDKCKTLATLCTLVIAAAGIMLPKPFSINLGWPWLILFFGALCLFLAIWIVLSYSRSLYEVVLQLLPQETSLESQELKKSLINSYYQCHINHDERNKVLGTLYSAARLYFLIGLTVVGAFFAIEFFFPPPTDRQPSPNADVEIHIKAQSK